MEEETNKINLDKGPEDKNIEEEKMEGEDLPKEEPKLSNEEVIEKLKVDIEPIKVPAKFCSMTKPKSSLSCPSKVILSNKPCVPPPILIL